ncbi:MAG: RecX family transcriptional regulator [Acidobacteria bacterium]|nr:RecX family transcriptional regulator [Acidobacteriota bacterium]MDW7984116.1 RecX family transcriptional regulator [Acidobacteriota bacterium]
MKPPLEAAVGYLRRYAVTRWELARWLVGKGYERSQVRDVLHVLERLGYLRDAWVLQSRVENARRRLWSRRRTARDLRRRGIPKSVVRKALDRWYPLEREGEIFSRWLQRYRGRPVSEVVRRARQQGFARRWVLRWRSGEVHNPSC